VKRNTFFIPFLLGFRILEIILMANKFVCVHMSSNYHLTVLNLFTYLLILFINCAYVIIIFIFSISSLKP
jgi:hypothetical protein